jgi:hypothetical protein
MVNDGVGFKPRSFDLRAEALPLSKRQVVCVYPTYVTWPPNLFSKILMMETYMNSRNFQLQDNGHFGIFLFESF